ncbi:MAG: trigger factor [Vulcanibacillus sp.]
MNVSWGKIENEKNKGILQVEVDVEKVKEALDLAFKKVVKTINVPGFRKGKVPRQVFDSRFGVEVLYNDALDILLPKAFEEAVKETGIYPVDRPDIDVEQFEKDKPLIFKATVVVKPEVELGEYIGVEVIEKDFTVKEEDINKELEKLQNRHAEVVILEEGTVVEGNTAVIDFEGFLDGVAFDGGKGTMHSLEIGSKSFIPGFEEQIIGMSKGEEKDIVVMFPEDYGNADLAGKETTFKIKLHEIKGKKIPELDDEFAKDVDFETLEELKQDTREKLEKNAEQDKENYYKEEAIKKVTENSNIDIPEVMINSEIEKMIKDFEQQLSYQGMNIDLYLQYVGMDLDGLKEQFKKDAVIRVKSDLVIESIGVKEQIEASDAELDAEYTRVAELYKRDIEEIKQIIGSNDEGIERVKSDIIFRKTINFIVDKIKPIKEG